MSPSFAQLKTMVLDKLHKRWEPCWVHKTWNYWHFREADRFLTLHTEEGSLQRSRPANNGSWLFTCSWKCVTGRSHDLRLAAAKMLSLQRQFCSSKHRFAVKNTHFAVTNICGCYFWIVAVSKHRILLLFEQTDLNTPDLQAWLLSSPLPGWFLLCWLLC